MKAGFGMKDDTSDITSEFLDNLFSYKAAKNESISFGRFKSFTDFESLNEAEVKFDTKKFLEATGEKGSSKELPKVEDLKDKLDSMVKDAYDKHKEGIDYILDKDFQPSEEGKKLFSTIFRVPWTAFKERLNDVQRKNTVAMGFKTMLEPTTGISKGIDKEVVDIYLKKEKKS